MHLDVGKKKEKKKSQAALFRSRLAQTPAKHESSFALSTVKCRKRNDRSTMWTCCELAMLHPHTCPCLSVVLGLRPSILIFTLLVLDRNMPSSRENTTGRKLREAFQFAGCRCILEHYSNAVRTPRRARHSRTTSSPLFRQCMTTPLEATSYVCQARPMQSPPCPLPPLWSASRIIKRKPNFVSPTALVASRSRVNFWSQHGKPVSSTVRSDDAIHPANRGQRRLPS